MDQQDVRKFFEVIAEKKTKGKGKQPDFKGYMEFDENLNKFKIALWKNESN